MARNCVRASSQAFDYASGAVVMTTPLTMACWFRSASVAVPQVLMSVSASASNNRFTLSARGDLGGDPIQAATVAAGVASVAVTSSGFSSGVWHHASGVWGSATDRHAFIDGGSKGTESTSRTPAGLDRTTIAGAYFLGAWSASYLDGDIAEATIWNVALTDAEVASLATGVHPYTVHPASIVAHWSLYGNDSPEPDLRGAYPLTLVNAPAKAEHPRMFYPGARLVGAPSYVDSGRGLPVLSYHHAQVFGAA